MSNGNVFAITTQEAGTIELEPGGRRQVVFNVQNLTGRPIDGRARAVVEGMPAQQAWYTVQGRMERRFDVDEVHQFIVEVAIPEDAQGGRYSFALEVNSVSRPDEDFGRSEKLLVVVPEPAKPGGGRSIPWWVWVVAASVVVVIGGVVTWILLSSDGRPIASDEASIQARAMAEEFVNAMNEGDVQTMVVLSHAPFYEGDEIVGSLDVLRDHYEGFYATGRRVPSMEVENVQVWNVPELRQRYGGGTVRLDYATSALSLGDQDLVVRVSYTYRENGQQPVVGRDSLDFVFRRLGDQVRLVGIYDPN